jgi:antitoxin component YwqK of YwqJK toxin-antitoxin module
MKKVAFWVLVFLVCSCQQDKPKIPAVFLLKSSKEVHFLNDEVFINQQKFSGYLYDLYPNKDTVSVEGYIEGKLSGCCRKWFPNKQLMEERFYYQGRKNGKQTAYWENGNKRFEFVAENDAYQGELKEWSFDGKLSHLGHFTDGQEEGSQKMWYDNGKIRANYVIIKGKRYGLLGTKNCKNVSDSIFIVK